MHSPEPYGGQEPANALHNHQVDDLKHDKRLVALDPATMSSPAGPGPVVPARTSGPADGVRVDHARDARRARPTGRNRVDAHIGARIRLRRKLVGLSQDTLADRLELTVQQVQKHERGRGRIEPARLFEIAQALGVDVGFFYEEMAMATLDDVGYETPQTTPGAEPRPEVVDLVHTILFGILARPATMDLIRSYGRISDPRLRRKVFEVIDDRSDDEA